MSTVQVTNPSLAEEVEPPKATRDTTYFLDSVVFQVEDAVFKVPKRQFEKNDVFSAMFTLPPPLGKEADGSSENQPLVLQGIAKNDFRGFLAVLYPMDIPHKYSDLPVEDWKAVLNLSSMWEFQSVRDLAIEQLGAPGMLDAVSRILLGMRYHVPQWLLSGCGELISRSEGPRANEVDHLGSVLTVRIYDLRETRSRAMLKGYKFELQQAVQKVFEDYLCIL